MLKFNHPPTDHQYENGVVVNLPQIHHSAKKDIKLFQSPAKVRSPSMNRPKTRIIANLADTKYQIVQEVCRQLGWKMDFTDNLKWDIKWSDTAITGQMLSRMGQHQKINHFPGMNTLSRKNTLAKNIKSMQECCPQEYMFIPRTFLLPYESQSLKAYAAQAKRKGILKTFIVKPQANCQGRGIFLTQSLRQIEIYEHCVVQKYILNPLLLRGLKFDLRVYALISGCDPLRIYIYNQGLVRLATQKYEQPNEENLDELCMHLTNYAINKNNQKYVFNDSIKDLSYGHKKSLASFFQTLKSMGYPAHTYWSDIKDIIVKSVISGQPHLQYQYRISQPNNIANNMCFEVLGFDFMIDQNNRSYLLQINHTPSFSTDTPLDQLIKSNLIRDTLILMNITEQFKLDTLEEAKAIQQRRVYTGKTIKMSNSQRKELIKQLQGRKDEYESKNLGSYEKIYPSKNKQKQKKYQILLQKSSQIYKQANNNSMRSVSSSNNKAPIKVQPYQFRIKKLITNNHTEQGETTTQNHNNYTLLQRNNSKTKIKKPDIFVHDIYQHYQPQDNNQGQSPKEKKPQVHYQNITQIHPQNTKPIYHYQNNTRNFNTKNEELTMFSRKN